MGTDLPEGLREMPMHDDRTTLQDVQQNDSNPTDHIKKNIQQLQTGRCNGISFEEANCVFNTNNFDSRQQFSLAQQFAMQSKLLPLLARTAIPKQRESKVGKG